MIVTALLSLTTFTLQPSKGDRLIMYELYTKKINFATATVIFI